MTDILHTVTHWPCGVCYRVCGDIWCARGRLAPRLLDVGRVVEESLSVELDVGVVELPGAEHAWAAGDQRVRATCA
jgi:hypothetical protein